MNKPEKFDVDNVVSNLLMWLRNHYDPQDLVQYEINLLDQWAPEWRAEFDYFERKVC